MLARILGASCFLVGLVLAASSALGQRVEARRGKTIVVGAPPGPSPADRVDAMRSGAARAPLPTGTLHVVWRRNLGLPVEAAPLVDGRGDVTILTARGDLIVLAADGEERSNTVVGSAAAGPATLLSDGTAAFLTSASDVVGVRLGAVRFRLHVGGGRSSVAPLALEDGGLVVATQGELVSLDGEGNVRARVAVDPEDPLAHPLVGARTVEGAIVYGTTASGAVVGWSPTAGAQLTRVGTFGAPIDGGMTLVLGGGKARGPALVAVQGAELVALDPATGQTTSRANGTSAGVIALLGPPLTQPSTRAEAPQARQATQQGAAREGATPPLPGVVSVLGLSASRTVALTFDASGAETLHRPIAPTLLPPLPDGGAALSAMPPHLGTLVDPQGDIAFALPTGEIGVVSPSGTVDVVSDVCTRFGAPAALASLGIRGGPTFAGFAPAAPSALVVACGTGVIARIDSDFAPSP